MHLRAAKLLGATLLASGLIGAVSASAAGPPPPPTSTNGNPVQTVVQVGSGLNTPTSFAFDGGKQFVGDFGAEDGSANGGVFLMSGGTATLVSGSPAHVFGLAFHNHKLYVSAATSTFRAEILVWSKWNGTTFTSQKVLVKGSKKFSGFNGLGFGANGRLYVGVSLTSNGDHGPATTPFEYDVLSYNAQGKDRRIVARGIRQPWQMAFPKGSNAPYVSDLGQDLPKGVKAHDFVLRVHQGDNFGFPKCNWIKPQKCQGYTRPFQMFKPHTDVMGLVLMGGRLYMSEFLGDHGKDGLVQSIPDTGGKAKTLLKGFVAPVVGLGSDGTYLYVGELTGQVFRVKI
jgi:glucose/arabinose dehydrogenase